MINTKVWQVYDEVGSAACASGHLVLARRMFSAAVSTCGFDKSMRTKRARSLIGLADTHYLSDDRQEAERLYKRVINMAIRFDTNDVAGRSILARALDRLGSLLMQQGQIEQSLKLLHRSARIFAKLHVDDTAHRQVLLRISYINSISGNSQAAYAALQQARRQD